MLHGTNAVFQYRFLHLQNGSDSEITGENKEFCFTVMKEQD
jgi:hypothetical protein